MSDEAKTGAMVMSKGGGLTPTTLGELIQLSEIVSASGMVPKDYAGKPAAALVAMQMGAELGLSPMASLQNIAVINGRPTLWGDGMLAVVRSHPACESIVERTAKGDDGIGYAECAVKRRGQAEHVVRFSVDDAKRAGLWGKAGPWTQYPRRMLQMRARAWALRDTFADALRGIGCAEEVRDYQIREDYVSPSAQAPAIEQPRQTTTERVRERVAKAQSKSAAEPVVDVTDWSEVGPPAMTEAELAAQSEVLDGATQRAREPGEDG